MFVKERNRFTIYFGEQFNNKLHVQIKLQTYAHAGILRHALPSQT